MTRAVTLIAVLMLLQPATLSRADEPVFSGPQSGEALPLFQARGVFGDLAGKQFDLVTQADGKPVAIVFVHEVNRPSVGFARLLMKYTATRTKDGLTSGVVFLTDNRPDTENWMRRAAHALPTEVPLGISVDGKEGPGAYGLNRNVTMTILIGKENKVTANFAFVQPSIEVDLPKVLKETVAAVGSGDVPTVASLRGPQRRGGLPPELASLVRALVQKEATPAEVAERAKKVDAYLEKNRRARNQLRMTAKRIIDAGKLDSYGTPPAREHIKRWAKAARPSTSD